MPRGRRFLHSRGVTGSVQRRKWRCGEKGFPWGHSWSRQNEEIPGDFKKEMGASENTMMARKRYRETGRREEAKYLLRGFRQTWLYIPFF